MEEILALGLVGLILAPFILMGVALYGLVTTLPAAIEEIEREKERKLRREELEFMKMERKRPKTLDWQGEYV